MSLLITGGMGFIGSAVVRAAVRRGETVINLDSLTYAANPANVAEIGDDSRHRFVQADIRDGAAIAALLAEHKPRAILHLAAESHVDRSIDGPAAFIDTNIVGTSVLLEATTGWWKELPEDERNGFRFLHVSTDEVYGTLGPEGAFTEQTPYAPNSPYAASKAGADHLARAWHHTYGLPVIISNCSNNYGPYQFPEKLIPLIILNALEGQPLPVYGDGANIRDWLHVEDHATALLLVLDRGRVDEKYNIGGNAERRNIEVVETVCRLMDERFPERAPHRDLIHFVKDRPGHDRRYAIDTTKIAETLGWRPSVRFEAGLAATLDWYIERRDWWQPLRDARARRGLGDGKS